jgi:glycosyltransferase involved in cell wall biosynthesis
MQVAAIIPQGKSQSRGEGVHVQTQSNTRTISGEEAIGFLGKPYFKNLPEILAAEKPDILVIGWPYALDLIFNSTLRNTIKKYKIKLIYKGIPFNLPAKNKIKSFYYSEQFTGGEADAAGKNFLGFLKFYLITQLRGFYLRMVDAHVYYIDEAIENIASYGVAKEKIFITYNSPDTDTHLAIEAQLHEQKAEHPNLLHVGRLVKWKRVDLLIDAYRKLKVKYPQLTLTIVGNGPEEANLKNYAAADADIIFLGAIYDPMELGRVFKSASIYVLAGMGGLSINEAMCYGLPIICSVADGTEKAIVRADYNGYYFERDNLTSLCDSIDLLLQDEAKLKLFGERSLRIIKEEINIRTVSKRYVKAFEYVMKGAARS